MKRMVVTVDSKELVGVYVNSPGYVTTYSKDGELLRRREATEQEVLTEQWVSRLEHISVNLEVAIANQEMNR